MFQLLSYFFAILGRDSRLRGVSNPTPYPLACSYFYRLGHGPYKCNPMLGREEKGRIFYVGTIGSARTTTLLDSLACVLVHHFLSEFVLLCIACESIAQVHCNVGPT